MVLIFGRRGKDKPFLVIASLHFTREALRIYKTYVKSVTFQFYTLDGFLKVLREGFLTMKSFI